MEKQNKKILIVFIVIAIIIIGFYLYKYFNLPKNTLDKDGKLIPSFSDSLDLNKTISFGEKSNNVSRLQTEINILIDKFKYPISKLSVDGSFGNKTAEALKIVSNNQLNGSNVTINKVISLGFHVGKVSASIENTGNTAPEDTIVELDSKKTYEHFHKADDEFMQVFFKNH